MSGLSPLSALGARACRGVSHGSVSSYCSVTFRCFDQRFGCFHSLAVVSGAAVDVCVQVTCGRACAFPRETHLQGWGCRARTCVLPTCEYSCWRENQQINNLKSTDLAKLPFKKVVPICFYTACEYLPPHFLRHGALANILILVRRVWDKKCVRCLYYIS